MASDVMSLFGMDPNVIQQNRVQKSIDNASRMSSAYAVGAASGGLAASGINSAFGLQTPDMAQAASVQQSMQGSDITTVAGLRAAAQEQMMAGNYPQAMALHERARDMEALENKAPSVSNQKTYITPDGKELVGYVVDGVPSYRENNAWIPIPDGATIKDTSKVSPFNITEGNIRSAISKMNDMGIDLGREDKNSAAEWVATRREALERAKVDSNDALTQAANEAKEYIDEGWLWFNDSWNPPTTTAAQPAASVTAAGTAISQNAMKYIK